MDHPTVICVTGMGRSGTSVTMRLLNFLGVSLGPVEHLMKPNAGNPTGYWENQLIVDINDDLLARLGGSWYEPPALRSGWQFDPNVADLKAKAKALIELDFGGHPVWGWKDPRSAATLPFWQTVMPHMKYVVCLRNPLDAALSLARRDGFPIERGGRLWLSHVSTSIKHTSGSPRLLVFFEDLMSDWKLQLRRLAAFIGKPELGDDRDVLESVEGFLDVSLGHHRSSLVQSLAETAIPYPTHALYLVLRGGVKTGPLGHGPRELGDDQLDSVVDVFCELSIGALEQWTAIRTQVAELKMQLEERTLSIKSLETALERSKAEIAERETRIAAVERSRSWRWTDPLRRMMVFARSRRSRL
jgi:hypothetical protein